MKPLQYLWCTLSIIGICHCQTCTICHVTTHCHCHCNNNNQSEALSISCDFTNQSHALADRLMGDNRLNSTHVTALNLSGLHAMTLSLGFLDGIASVGKLIMSRNQLTDFPVCVSGIREVECEDLSHNRISRIDTSQFIDGMTFSTRTLDLSHNRVGEVREFDMRYFPELIYLDLSFNEIRTIGGYGMYLPRLVTLDVSQNKISTIEALDLGPDSKLMSLNLSMNPINNLHEKSFSSLLNLKTIDLSKNTQIKNVESLKFPEHVSYLDLHSCGIQEIDECYLLHVRDLIYLDISGNNITCSCRLSWLFHQIHVNREYRKSGDLKHRTMHTKSNCFDTETKRYANIMNNSRNCSDEGRESFHLHCQTYEVRRKHLELQAYVNNFQFEVALDSVTVTTKWSESNSSLVHGFKLEVRQIDGSAHYDSAVLHPSVSSFANSDPAFCCGTFSVCIRILLNGTYTYHKECQIVDPHSTKFVIGIIAGSVFLIPCVGVLILVYVRDKKHKKEQGYKEVPKQEKEKEETGSHSIEDYRDRSQTPILGILRDNSTFVGSTDPTSDNTRSNADFALHVDVTSPHAHKEGVFNPSFVEIT